MSYQTSDVSGMNYYLARVSIYWSEGDIEPSVEYIVVPGHSYLDATMVVLDAYGEQNIIDIYLCDSGESKVFPLDEDEWDKRITGIISEDEKNTEG